MKSTHYKGFKLTTDEKTGFVVIYNQKGNAVGQFNQGRMELHADVIRRAKKRIDSFA